MFEWDKHFNQDMLSGFNCVQLFATLGKLLCPWDPPGKNIGVGCHALLQGILLTQGSCGSWIVGRFFTTEPPGICGVFIVKQITLPNMGGLCPISWKPDLKKKTGLQNKGELSRKLLWTLSILLIPLSLQNSGLQIETTSLALL